MNHSSLNARQWKDIRQAAHLARSEGVFIVMHGVKLSPHNSNLSETTGLSNQRPAQPVKKNDAVSDALRERVPAPRETDGAAPTTSKTSRKQQREETRSATRLLEYQKKVLAKQREARWLLLTQPLQ